MTDETLPVARPRLRVLRPFRRWYRDLVIRRRAAFVVSYPKSGRTWLRLLLAHAFVPLTGRPLSLNLTVYRNRTLGIPYILFSHDGTDTAAWREDLGDKRAFAGRPVLLLVRDPRDVLVSYYFDLSRRSHRFAGDLDAFLHSPQFGIDRMIDFLNSWVTHAHVPSKFEILRYEEMHADAAGALRRAVGFFGVPDIPDAVVARAAEQTSFPRMRAMEARGVLGDGRLRPADPHDAESYKVRRGRVGGYADYLTSPQIDFLNDRLRARLAASYRDYWL